MVCITRYCRLVLAPQGGACRGDASSLIGAPFFIAALRVDGDGVNSGRYVVLMPWVSLRIHRRSATVACWTAPLPVRFHLRELWSQPQRVFSVD